MSLPALAELCAGRRIAVLTGAGCSTESGIPDYRGDGARRRRPVVQFQELVRNPGARRRYWARSMLGWPRFAAAQPNRAHRALAELERCGRVRGLITQNVDGLHGAAGNRNVVELHGNLSRVRCLGCGAIEPRAELQERLAAANPELLGMEIELGPDGDAELPDALVADFRVQSCRRCDGMLKPDVVLFGENVAREVVDAAFATLSEGDALLVVGTSLAVFSGFRFVRAAAERGMPIAIVNQGPTRGDPHASVRVSGRAGEVLSELAAGLG